jgi:hypothetical protein
MEMSVAIFLDMLAGLCKPLPDATRRRVVLKSSCAGCTPVSDAMDFRKHAMNFKDMVTRCTWLFRACCLGFRLRALDIKANRIAGRDSPADGDAARRQAHRLEAVDVERARMAYLKDRATMRANYLNETAAKRMQSSAVRANAASGHSPRFRASVPNAADR